MNAEDLKSILIKTGLFLAAVFLGVFVAPEEPFLVIGICLGLFVLIALGRSGRGLWVIFPLSSGFSGAINLIPGGMTPIQISSLVLVFMCLYLLKADASFRIRFGPGWFFWPLLLLNLILIYKGIPSVQSSFFRLRRSHLNVSTRQAQALEDPTLCDGWLLF
jgi:hypothetical protein